MVRTTPSELCASWRQARSDTVPLVLHRVVRSSPATFEDVEEEIFLAIVSHIAGRSVTLQDVPRQRERARQWLLTFDDGNASDFDVVFPALQRASVKAVFFVIVGRVGMPGYLSWERIREMHRYGMEFGSHGMTHASMTTLDKRQVLEEFKNSRLEIEARLGYAANSFAFPYGDYSRELIRLALESGYAACCISDHGTVNLPASVIPRNSINGSMGWRAVRRALEPSAFGVLRWNIEDWTKRYIKRRFGDDIYRKVRGVITGVLR